MKKKRKYFLNLFLLKKGINFNFKKLIFKSIFLNKEVKPYVRLFFLLDILNKYNFYYKSKIKLLCILTTNKRVPNKRYFVNRFFLAKYSDNLTTSLFVKK